MSRTRLGWIALFFLMLGGLQPAYAALLFGVNEGTSSSLDSIFRQDKYADLTRQLSAASGQAVKLETSNILSVVIRNLERRRYDILLIRPSHISARAMRDHGYRLLVTAKGDARTHFIVKGDSPLKSLQDIHGRFLVMPDVKAYPANIASALLRDRRIQPGRLQNMNRQEAVGYAVKEGLADVGVVISYSQVARTWEKEGGRFLYTKDQLPFWSVIVSDKIDATLYNKLQQAFLDLDKTPRGRDMLKKAGVSGFVPGDQQAYLNMLDWIEGKAAEPK